MQKNLVLQNDILAVMTLTVGGLSRYLWTAKRDNNTIVKSYCSTIGISMMSWFILQSLRFHSPKLAINGALYGGLFAAVGSGVYDAMSYFSRQFSCSTR